MPAARNGVTVSEFCNRAIDRALTEDEDETMDGRRRRWLDAIQRMHDLREEIGPIGITVRDLIHEGHDR